MKVKCCVYLKAGSMDLHGEGLITLFSKLEEDDSIIELSLSNSTNYKNKFTKASWEALTQLLIKNQTLTILNLSTNLVSQSNISSIIKGVKGNCGNLLSLDLAHNNLNAKCISMFEDIILTSNISILNLSENAIGDDGVFALQDILSDEKIAKHCNL
jgi:hypothetical protein